MRGSDYSFPIDLAQICLVDFSQRSIFLSLRFSDLYCGAVPLSLIVYFDLSICIFIWGGGGMSVKSFFIWQAVS